MGWTDPSALADLANGGVVSCTVLNRDIRDNLRALFSPPRAVATNDSVQNVVKRATIAEPPFMVNFGRLLEDNYSMHAAADQIGEWAPSVAMRTRVAGRYLIGAEVYAFAETTFEAALAITQRGLGEPWPSDPPLFGTTGAQLAASANEHELSCETVLNLPADRVVAVALLVAQPSGVTVKVGSSPSSPVFGMTWIGG